MITRHADNALKQIVTIRDGQITSRRAMTPLERAISERWEEQQRRVAARICVRCGGDHRVWCMVCKGTGELQ